MRCTFFAVAASALLSTVSSLPLPPPSPSRSPLAFIAAAKTLRSFTESDVDTAGGRGGKPLAMAIPGNSIVEETLVGGTTTFLVL